MIDNVLFVGWNRPIVGRETRAVELFNSFLSYLGKMQQQGVVDTFEPVLLDTHGGDLNGFIVVRGDRSKLMTLKGSNEWLDLTTQVTFCVEGFGVIDGWVNDGLKTQMTRYINVIK